MNQKCNVHSPITCNEMITLFHEANEVFISQNSELFTVKISERTLCGALMIAIYETIHKGPDRLIRYRDYKPDLEYNRNSREKKTIMKKDKEESRITCDLIVHSRGHNKGQDNLIAIEMKKATRPESEKQSDKERLMALTQTAGGVWHDDGKALPKHIYGYVLGIYYE